MWLVLKRSMLVGVVCLAGASGTANAGTNLLEVKIPFPFVVGDQTLPAGRYLIQRDDYAPGALMLRNEHAAAAAILNTRPAVAAASPSGDQPSLQFTRGENGYRLSNVWMSDGVGAAVAH